MTKEQRSSWSLVKKYSTSGPTPKHAPHLGPCWEWKGFRDPKGYGKVSYLGKMTSAHRAVFMASGGVIPNGLHLDHLCSNRGCVNPSHLEPVTAETNCSRKVVHSRSQGLKAARPRPSVLTLRLTTEERNQIEAEATDDGRTLSDWVRRRLNLTANPLRTYKKPTRA